MEIRAAGRVMALQQAGYDEFGALGPNRRDQYITSYNQKHFVLSSFFVEKHSESHGTVPISTHK